MKDFEVNQLPRRTRPRPMMSPFPPHVQHDQAARAEVVAELAGRVKGFSEVGERDSRMALPGVKAFWIPDSDAGGPPNAFIDDHEFCHLHVAGTMHLTLPGDLRKAVIERGWAEQHMMARAGLIPDTVVVVYAPGDEAELDVVTWIARQSFEFATRRRKGS